MRKKSILLVEDDVQVRESTRLILETRYNVSEASDYSGAVNKFKEPLDLAIIDYILPDYDGFDRKKREEKGTKRRKEEKGTGYFF